MGLKTVVASLWKDDAPLVLKVGGMYLLLILFNLAALIVTVTCSISFPEYLYTGVLAYTFGLRHAVDADHIAAIDNVVRKLVGEGKKPVAVGFFFSMGHSTIVLIMSIGVAFGAPLLESKTGVLQHYGGIIGTTVSATFLFLIGLVNLVVLVGVFKAWRKVSKGGEYDQEQVDNFLNERGFMNRCCGTLIGSIRSSWQMYPVGLLFGLGFDTATEVGLIALSLIAKTKQGMPPALVIFLPFIFASGMSLIDTTDGILMIWCYGWAFVKPVRKLFYNLVVTLISVLVAFIIGIIEVLSILADRLELEGAFWDGIRSINSFALGMTILGVFGFSMAFSFFYYKWMGYDSLESSSSPEIGYTGTINSDSSTLPLTRVDAKLL